MKLSRRQFARAASVAVGAALLPRRALADETAPASHAAGGAPPTVKLAPAAQAESDARLQLIVSRWSARLSAGERVAVAGLCGNLQRSLDAVRAYPLDSGDEPAPIFRASRRKR